MSEARSEPVKAAGYMVGAMVSFSLMAIAGRELAGTLDTFEIMMYRSFVGVTIVLVVAGTTGTLPQIRRNRLRLHFLRNLVHFVGQNLWFYALIYIPLSQLFAFEFTNPLWVAVLAPFFLGEQMTRMRILSFVLGFVGILIVARPASSALNPATIAAALCAIGFAGAVITTKMLSRTETTTCILFWLVTMQAFFGLVCAGFDGDIALPDRIGALWVSLVGVCGLLAHFCITTALKLAPATVVAPLEFLRLPLIAVVGWLVYNEALEAVVFVGAAIIFGANYLNIRAEQTKARSQRRHVPGAGTAG
ncbi:MAG: DMT family transporter [Rhodobacteraceae bacterium]|nr:DMT family transporter [Paracoccaceae bacterium]